MRILHTSDWHLGQKFLHNDRETEHRLALDWLRHCIETHKVDALIVSGDIFDVGNPPNYALQLYYRFLTGLLGSSCRNIVITGGNHDSPSTLDAPRELLQALNIQVLGAAPEQPEDALLLLKDAHDRPIAVVAAVPFLRDRDLRQGGVAANGFDRVTRVREGIVQHYQQLAVLAEPYRQYEIPILATGHLYAFGAASSDKQDNIYLGDVANIEARQFPEIFDYVALGHIHRAQPVGDSSHIRYSGSLLPLSFSEVKDDKSVCLLNFEGRTLKSIEPIPVPVFRRLKTIQGDLEAVKSSLERFAAKPHGTLTPWVEVLIETDEYVPQMDVQLRDFAAGMNLELLKIRVNRIGKSREIEEETAPLALEDLEVSDVFRKRCEQFGIPETESKALMETFLELRQWMQEKQDATLNQPAA
ncbi:MAG: exonuclease SbcCD subunit D C-terminal domain-containing protein [Saprospiraceae bacterium]|nr:exonuclease SbcCD subunit D C-terminal domain-containing protein [Saprospiraceae bacterium]